MSLSRMLPSSSSQFRTVPAFLAPSTGRPHFNENDVFPPRVDAELASWNDRLGCCGTKLLVLMHRILHTLLLQSLAVSDRRSVRRSRVPAHFLARYRTDFLRRSDICFEWQSSRRRYCDACIRRGVALLKILARFMPQDTLTGVTAEKFYVVTVGLEEHASARLAMAGGFLLCFLAIQLPTNIRATFRPSRISPDLCYTVGIGPASLELLNFLNEWGGERSTIFYGNSGEIVANRYLSPHQDTLVALQRERMASPVLRTSATTQTDASGGRGADSSRRRSCFLHRCTTAPWCRSSRGRRLTPAPTRGSWRNSQSPTVRVGGGQSPTELPSPTQLIETLVPTSSPIDLEATSEDRLPTPVRDFMAALREFDLESCYKESPDSPDSPADNPDAPSMPHLELCAAADSSPVSPHLEPHSPLGTPPLLPRECDGASDLDSISSLGEASEDGSECGLD